MSESNEERNKDIVLKRVSDPIKWSFGELGKIFKLHKTTVEEIFKRDIEKYATKKQRQSYVAWIEKLNNKGLKGA